MKYQRRPGLRLNVLSRIRSDTFSDLLTDSLTRVQAYILFNLCVDIRVSGVFFSPIGIHKTELRPTIKHYPIWYNNKYKVLCRASTDLWSLRLPCIQSKYVYRLVVEWQTWPLLHRQLLLILPTSIWRDFFRAPFWLPCLQHFWTATLIAFNWVSLDLQRNLSGYYESLLPQPTRKLTRKLKANAKG